MTAGPPVWRPHLSPALVIFDCDGVLVDSEIIANQVNARAFLPYLPEPWNVAQFVARYAGWPDQQIARDLNARYGCHFPADLHATIVQAVDAALMQELREVAGASQALARLSLAKAVASNSPARRLARSLKSTGLDRFFGRHIYSSDLVARPKPEPDIYFYTAWQTGAEPARCLVVEDSARGITAAVRAGMTAIGFVGGAHATERDSDILREAGAAIVIDSMADLADLLMP